MSPGRWDQHGIYVLTAILVCCGGIRAQTVGDIQDVPGAILPLLQRESPDFSNPPEQLPDPTLPDPRTFDPLRRPLDTPPPQPAPVPLSEPGLVQYPFDRPTGFAGPSGIRPRETQQDPHFVPIEDRWRIGFPLWDRYGQGHRGLNDYPYVTGNALDPFNLNMLKGNYPILGQNTFLEVTGTVFSIFEPRQVPTPTTPFETTSHAPQEEFFGRNDQYFQLNNFILSIDLFHGDAAFKPPDWRIKLTPIFDVNYLTVEEVGIVSSNVNKGTSRGRGWVTLQEYFIEKKLADISPNFDFVSVRAGSQPFNSDFRGFIFNDVNRAVRLFGTAQSNREQFNLLYFRQQEKDTNSLLNSFNDRGQDIVIGNFFVQDFLFPGYTSMWNVHYNHDNPSFHLDRNGFLVRPDPVGVFQPHELNVVYLGWNGDGHINRFNISHAMYWALGHDSLNPLANRPQDISAGFGAAELSYDKDYIRFRTSTMYATGDGNPNNAHATGFDSILDFPNFAGGMFTYWQRQAIPLNGVNLTQRFSFLPDLRSSKVQGQSNFVNPGFELENIGFDVELTPRMKLINNYNAMWFDNTASLNTFLFQQHIHRFIGFDLSMGLEYRPLLSNNVIVQGGIATLIPGQGFRDLYNRLNNPVNPLLSSFMQLTLTY